MKPGENELEGPLLVAVAVAGTLPSAYPNGAPAGVTPAGELITRANADARILVVSNGEFMFANPRIGYGDDVARFGVLFFLNTMDWLVQDEALIRIRSKGVPRMLEPVDTETQRLLQVANIGVIPVSVALIGLIVWGFRSWRRLRIHASFSGRSTAGR